MATNPTSLEFVQGDTVSISIDWQDTAGNPVDLSGATIASQIRKEYHTDVLASFTVVETDLANGQFTLSLSAATSAGLPVRSGSRITSFVFDVSVTLLDGTIQTPIWGYLKMQRQVTI